MRRVPRVDGPPSVRFWAKVQKSDGCWLWLGGRSTTGYGRFRGPDKSIYAPIPEGLTLDHLCRTPLCVRPDHLEAVTQAVNNRRGTSPWALNRRKTHCKRGHPFDAENTYWTKDGTRSCRTCHRVREAAAKRARHKVSKAA